MRYGYLLVEGPHDVEFIARLLKPHGLDRTKRLSDVDEVFRRMVPTKFPPDGEDLLGRVNFPLFFCNSTHCIALHPSRGDANLIRTLRQTLDLLETLPEGVATMTGIGILLDADSRTLPVQRFDSIKNQLAALSLPVADRPGVVAAGPPRCGVYVLPDNATAGTLEDLLLEAAGQVYPSLLARAQTFVQGTDLHGGELRGRDREEFAKPAGRSKATAGCIASILKPGKAIQVSIQDNRWIEAGTLALPRIRQVQQFLEEILQIERQV